MSEAVVCSIGCCGGCQDCYGMSIGCHQDPCRCGEPCVCDWTRDETPRLDCPRHDMTEDTRRSGSYEEGYDLSDLAIDAGLASKLAGPCPECGAVGACGWDAEGRPLIHPTPEDGAR